MSKSNKFTDLLSSTEQAAQSRNNSNTREPSRHESASMSSSTAENPTETNYFKPAGMEMEHELIAIDNDFNNAFNVLQSGPTGVKSSQIGSHEVAARSDGRDVMAFLNNQKNLSHEELTYSTKERQVNHPYDTNFTLPQTTRSSLIQDGQDIVDYLRKNRYTDDMDAKTADFDVNSLIAEFEQSTDSHDRLRNAVARLELLLKHLGQ